MRFFYGLVSLFVFGISSLQAQHFKYYADNTVQLLHSNGQRIPYPFAGGFIAPQFSTVDLDMDGKKDLVVFDRSGFKVLTFINTGGPGYYEYRYAPEYEDAFPVMNSWMMMRDFDGDGKEDLFTAADAFFAPSAIKVFKNVSTNSKFMLQKIHDPLRYTYMNNDSSFLDTQDVYVANIDYPALVDWENDGDLDIISFSLFGTNVQLFENLSQELHGNNDTLRFRLADECWGGFQEGSTSSSIDLGKLCFADRFYTNRSGAHFGSTVNALDLDKDGDLDPLLGDVSSPKLLALTNGRVENSWPWDTMVYVDTAFPSMAQRVDLPEFVGSFYIDVTNDGIRDLIVAPNATIGKNTKQVWFYKNERQDNWPLFNLIKKDFVQEYILDFGSGCAPAFFDADGDGKLDLLVANRGDKTLTQDSNDRIALFRNVSPNADTQVYRLTDTNYLQLTSYKIVDMKPTFGDLNGDGKEDLIIGQSNGTLRYFENTGTTSTPAFTQVTANYMGIDVGKSAAPQIIDLDRDGKNDLVIGCEGGNVFFFQNTGTVNIPAFSATPTIDSLGKIKTNDFYLNPVYDSLFIDTIGWDTVYLYTGYATPHIADLDNDNKYDMLVGSENGKLFVYYNIEDHTLSERWYPDHQYRYSAYHNNFTDIDLGGRIAPSSYFDAKLNKRNLLIGNFRGGLNYLKSDTGITGSVFIPEASTEFTMYPNPAFDMLHIKLDDGGDRISGIVIYNTLGERLKEELNPNQKYLLKLPVDGLPNGVYFVQVRTHGGKSASRKLVKLAP